MKHTGDIYKLGLIIHWLGLHLRVQFEPCIVALCWHSIADVSDGILIVLAQCESLLSQILHWACLLPPGTCQNSQGEEK